MQSNTYMPGYSAPVLAFMKQRRADTHAAFFLPLLKAGFRVLDAGCGPGTITLGLARQVAPGQVVGIDIEDSQFGGAREEATRELLNATFQKASIYQLPYEEATFDAVFSHAVLQHLSDPFRALIELRRVLKPGGVVGIKANDMGGILIDSESDETVRALASCISDREADAGDPRIGRKLPRLLRQAGFKVEQISASYEVMDDLRYELVRALVAQFSPSGSCSLQEKPDESLFAALPWCEVIGRA